MRFLCVVEQLIVSVLFTSAFFQWIRLSPQIKINLLLDWNVWYIYCVRAYIRVRACVHCVYTQYADFWTNKSQQISVNNSHFHSLQW